MQVIFASVDHIISALEGIGGSGTGRQLAEYLANKYPSAFEERICDKYPTREKLLAQISAEIGSRVIAAYKGDTGGQYAVIRERIGDRREIIGKRERKVLFLKDYKEVQEDVEPVETPEEKTTRAEKQKEALIGMSYYDEWRVKKFTEICRDLSALFNAGSFFNVDHAKSLDEHGAKAHNPDNMQIMVAHINKSKNNSSWERFSWEQQEKHIRGQFDMRPDGLGPFDHRVLDSLIVMLKEVY